MLIGTSAHNQLEITFTGAGEEADRTPQALSCIDALHGRASRWSSGTRLWHWEGQ
jgi:hypothetical protein